MPDDALIVPVLLPHGSLHFSTVKQSSTIQDVLDALSRLKEVHEEVLGDLRSDAWALQRIRLETHGRTWEEDELESRGDGVYSYESTRLLLCSDTACQAFSTPPSL
jgi:diaphanous 1